MKWTKRQIVNLRDRMRQQGRSDDEIADEVRHRCGCSPMTAYRRMLGWSQAEAADRFRSAAPGLVLDQTALSRLELWPGTGGRAPQASHVIALASLYGASPRRLLSPEGLDALEEHERNVILRVSEQTPRSEAIQAPHSRPVSEAPPPHHIDTNALPLERQVAMAAKRAMRFAALAEGSNAGPETVQQLFDEVARLSALYPKTPLNEILGDLVSAQDVAFLLLEGRQRPSQTRDLYLLSGVLSLMLAKASQDLGDTDAAMKQARTAFVCADNAEHDGLRLRVRTLQSLMAYWAGWTSEAVRYAGLGRGLVRSQTGTAGVWLLAQGARSWAALGNTEQALHDLDAAADVRERLEEDDLDQLGGLMGFARCRQLYYAADAQIWLAGREAEARQTAEETVALYEDAAANGAQEWSYSDEAGARADLGYARICLGEVEGAAQALEPVFSMPPEQRIAGVVHSVMRVHAALRRPDFVGSKQVQQLRQEIEGYSQVSVAALPRGR